MPTVADIRTAAERIAPYVRATPLVQMTPSRLWLKAECLHPTGAFKLRGAFNAILSLEDEQRARGVVAHSSGNHAQAVAYAAAALGVRAVIVMPSDAPAIKLEATRRYAPEIVIVGPASSERAMRAAQIACAEGLAPIEPYSATATIAGTATIALEMLDAKPDVETIYVPVSGGGLIGGIALAVKLLAPHVRVIGAEPEVAADALASLRAGRLVELPGEQMALTIADGLRVQRLGALNWPLVRDHVDDIATVSEDAIIATMRRIALEARLVAEPSGAVAPAAALEAYIDPERCIAILSGGNVDPALFARAMAPIGSLC